jgi:hypothetical protein
MDPQTANFMAANLSDDDARPAGRRTGGAGVVSTREGRAQLKESPQAQELPALGLSMVKPCFSIVSAKSMVAPSR